MYIIIDKLLFEWRSELKSLQLFNDEILTECFVKQTMSTHSNFIKNSVHFINNFGFNQTDEIKKGFL